LLFFIVGECGKENNKKSILVTYIINQQIKHKKKEK